MREPYRVIVWGPGSIGQGCMRELLRLPEFEIAAVVGYSENKNGMDIGDLLGMDKQGVTITTDKDAVVAMDADVVLWCGTFPFPHLVDEMNDYVIRLLESGKHVITPVAYHYPPFHGDAYAKRIEDACAKGNSCLHGTGENTGFWFERLGVTLTGLCNDVESMTLDEYIDCGTIGSEFLEPAGFGKPLDEFQASTENGPLAGVWDNYYYVHGMNLVSLALYGKRLERFERDVVAHLAEESFELSKDKGDIVNVRIEKGTVAAQTYRFRGYVDGENKLSISCNWFILPENSPFEGKEDSTWDIEIEGKPTSIRMTARAMASFKDNQVFYPNDPTSPTWYTTIVPCIQAIPKVCAHEPGIVYPDVFAYAAPDLRLLETRKSMIG